MKELVEEKGADVNYEIDGYTPLSCALKWTFENGDEIVKYLIEKGADVTRDDCALYAVSLGKKSLELLKLMVSRGVDLNRCSEKGLTPITSAALNENWPVVMFLADNGADVNLCPERFWTTAIHQAAEKGRLEELRHLCSKGANINLEDRNGKTPAFYATQEGHLDVLKYLKSLGNNE